MIKYKRELRNRGNNGIQFTRPKEMIVMYLRIRSRWISL